MHKSFRQEKFFANLPPACIGENIIIIFVFKTDLYHVGENFFREL